MKETFKIAALRQRSEDIIEIFSVGSQRVIILCDGAGGFGGGFEAATTCVSVVKDELLTKTKITQEDIYESIIKSCYKLSRGNIGQTTAIVLVVEGSVVIGASCGDSDAYMLMGEDIIHITEKQHNVRVGDFGILIDIFIANNSPIHNGFINFIGNHKICS